MSAIYYKAEMVYIWLGTGSYETDAALQFLLEVNVIPKRYGSDNAYKLILRDLKELYNIFVGKQI